MKKIEAVLFDLDGTLVDTAADLIHALNLLLLEIGQPKAEARDVINHVSGGSYAIIKAGLKGADDKFIEQLQSRYLELYQSNISRYSRLFDGMELVINTLEENGIPWGIVTNKPEFLALDLLRELALDTRCCAIICGDTTPHAKPHPEPLFEACKRCEINPDKCLYIGDDLRDIQAGNSAGMTTLSAAWGYDLPADKIETWPAKALLTKPEEILSWLYAID